MLIIFFQRGRKKGNADVAKETCLNPDLPNEGGNGRVVLCRRHVQVRKSKAIVRIKKRDCFVVHLFAGAEEGRTEVDSFWAKPGPERRWEVDGSTLNE
jgi:hypothetical protein